MNDKLQGKVALITGANRGIGRCIAESFVNAGVKKIYLAVRDVQKVADLASRYPKIMVPAYVDLTVPNTVQTLANIAEDVDVLINNAGILSLTSVLDEHMEATFLREIEVNVFGLLRMAKAFAPTLARNGDGILVQLNSVASIISNDVLSTYSASKAASYSFTLALRQILQEHNIRVISVHPGPIDTDMASEAGMQAEADPPEVVAQAIIKAIQENQFLVFPDCMAKEFETAYSPYADAFINQPGSA